MHSLKILLLYLMHSLNKLFIRMSLCSIIRLVQVYNSVALLISDINLPKDVIASAVRRVIRSIALLNWPAI